MRFLAAVLLLSAVAFAEQPPCPTGYHHEGDAAACWPDVSHQQGLQAGSSQASATPDSQSSVVAATPKPTEVSQPKQLASLTVFREGHFTGSALKPSIYLDGREVARLKNGSYFTMPIEPGTHNLGSSAKHEPPLVIEIKPGEPIYIQMIVVTGTWRGAGRLIPVSPDDGKVAVSKLRVLD